VGFNLECRKLLLKTSDLSLAAVSKQS